MTSLTPQQHTAFLEFEKSMLSNPKTFFPMFEVGFKNRSHLIWREFIEWQKNGVLKDFSFRVIGEDILTWQIGNEHFAQKISKSAPFSIEQYEQGIKAVFSFMEDRPQYFKFRHLDGMFNPLKLLLYKFL